MLNYAAALFSSKHNSQPEEKKNKRKEKQKKRRERIKRDPKIYITEKKKMILAVLFANVEGNILIERYALKI